ncbi:MAG: STAS domain-containing protein [Actinomycetota bacterium]|nr:STAS domain-containing protein [Actinomycetota bacterium]
MTTLLNDAELVVRISGEVDLFLQPELEAAAKRVIGYDGQVLVDVAGVTFCDATLARFLSETVDQALVSVHAPSRLVREFLVLYGLARRVPVVGDSGGQAIPLAGPAQ